LSEEGIQPTSKNGKSTIHARQIVMHKIDEALYFVIEEKNNQLN
jgi:hypothetical protein